MDKQHPTKLTSAVYRVTELFPQNEPLRYKTREIADEILADFVLFQDLEKQNAETEQGFLRRNRVKNQIFSKIKILNDYYFDLAREQVWVNPLNFLILKREYDKMKSDIKIQLAQAELPISQNGSAIVEPVKSELEPEFIEPEIPTISDKPSNVSVQQDELRQVLENADVFLKQDIEEKEPEQPSEPVESAPEESLGAVNPKPKVVEAQKSEQSKLSARHKEILKIIEQGGKKQVGEIRESFPSLSKRTLRRDLEFLLKQGYVDRVGQWNEVSYRVRT